MVDITVHMSDEHLFDSADSEACGVQVTSEGLKCELAHGALCTVYHCSHMHTTQRVMR